jgi:RecA-family ATPase
VARDTTDTIEFEFEDVVPVVENLEQIVNSDESDPEILIQGLLAVRGRLLVGGEPGVGKSLFATQLGLAIASGGEMLGMKCTQRRVMYAQAELTAAELRKRIRLQLAAYPCIEPDSFYHYTAEPWDWHDQLRALIAAIEAAEAKVLILDPLNAMLPIEMNVNENRDMRIFLRRTLAGLQAYCHLDALIIVHHFRKPSEEGWKVPTLARMEGAGQIGQWVDGFVGILGLRSSNERTIVFDKPRSFEPKPTMLTLLDPVTLTFRELDYRQKILLLLDDGGDHDRAELAAALNLELAKLHTAVQPLIREGLVEAVGKGKVRLL